VTASEGEIKRRKSRPIPAAPEGGADTKSEDHMTDDELRERIIDLGPWSIDIQVTPALSTAAYLDAPPGTYPEELGRPHLSAPHEGWSNQMRSIYPNGLEGRSFLDCGCNCGAYCFFAKELGAGHTYGFDARDHWLRQAEFLRQHRTVGRADDMTFALHDLYELERRDVGVFDITLFSGLFYHLPDPMTGLRLAADQTRELIFVNTATQTVDTDEGELPDGYLRLALERRERVMSGVHGLAWYPTGPVVVQRVLEWCGFPETRLLWWRKDDGLGAGHGRLAVCGARSAETFALLDERRNAVSAGSLSS